MTDLITVTEYARRVGLSPQRIRVLIAQGRITGAVRLTPRMWVIPAGARITPPRPA